MEEDKKVNDTLIAEINTAIDANLAAKADEKTPERKAVDSTTLVSEVKPEVKEDDLIVDANDKVVKETVVEKPKPSNDTITRAIRAGLSIEDAQSFQSEAALSRVVASIETARRPMEVPESQVEEEDIFSQLPTLNPDDYEEDVIKMYDSLTAIMKKQQETINELKGRTEQSAASSRDAIALDTSKWFDEQVSKLGDEFADSLGTGGYHDLDRSTPQFAKRDELANQCAVLIAGYRASGQQLPPRDEVFSRAASIVLKDNYLKAHEKKLSSELADRKSQHIARASSANSKSKGDTAADVAAMLDAKFFGKA